MAKMTLILNNVKHLDHSINLQGLV